MASHNQMESELGVEVRGVDASVYRSGALASLPSCSAPVEAVNRRSTFRDMTASDSIESGAMSPEAITELYGHRVPRNIGSACLATRVLEHVVCTCNIAEAPQGKPRTGDVVTTVYKMPYDYLDVGVNQAVVHTENAFFAVPPALEPTRLSVLQRPLSIETAAKDLGIKLPRLISGLSQHKGPGDTYSNFESLRGAVVASAQSDDYGLRLFSLARVVLHAFVAKEYNMVHNVADATYNVGVQQLMTAETPLLTSQAFDQGLFIYVGDEVDPCYRAFLALGLLGVENNVGQNKTVYSRLVTHNEATTRSTITYVLQTGGQPAITAPTGVEMCYVLNNPRRCLSYYYTYAMSLGLGRYASSVLRQTSIMPFMFNTSASLPYRASVSPKADAYLYLLRDTTEDFCPVYNDISDVVYTAPVIANVMLSGAGAIAFTYRLYAVNDALAIMAATKAHLASESESRRMFATILVAYGGVTGDLEWVNPFTEDADAAMDKCTQAFREYGWLMSTYNSVMLSGFSAILRDGVDMRNAEFAYKPHKRPYTESIILSTLLGEPWRFMDEPVHSATRRLSADVKGYQHWLAIVQWNHYAVGQGAKTNVITPTPITPKGAESDITTVLGPRSGRMLTPQAIVPKTVTQTEGSTVRSHRRYSSGTLLPLKLAVKHSKPPQARQDVSSVVTDTVSELGPDDSVSVVRMATNNLDDVSPTSKPQESRPPSRTASSVSGTTVSMVRDNKHSRSHSRTNTVVSAPQTRTHSRTPSARGTGTVVEHSVPKAGFLEQVGGLIRRKSSDSGLAVGQHNIASPPKDRAANNMNISTHAMLRGPQEQAEVNAVLNSESTTALIALVANLVTQDGRLAAITKLAATDKRLAGNIAEQLDAGGVGGLDVEHWIGTTSDAKSLNKTTMFT